MKILHYQIYKRRMIIRKKKMKSQIRWIFKWIFRKIRIRLYRISSKMKSLRKFMEMKKMVRSNSKKKSLIGETSRKLNSFNKSKVVVRKVAKTFMKRGSMRNSNKRKLRILFNNNLCLMISKMSPIQKNRQKS